jgi:NADPH:quinone reductase
MPDTVMADTKMLEAVFHPLPTAHVELHTVPIPTPPAKYLLIKVAVAASNPKDWEHPTSLKLSVNSGDDLAGTVAALGTDVPSTFHIGDRVAAFHLMLAPGGAYAEYSLAPAATTFHIPDGLSFEEASTIPLVSATAAVTLFRRQHLPAPWTKSDLPPTPLIIYGASSSLGSFAVKLAILANIHPIIAIAGSGASYLSKFIDTARGDKLFNYRDGIDQVIQQVKSHLASLGNLEAHHAFDCISKHDTWVPLSKMLTPSSSSRSLLSVVSGAQKYDSPEIQPGVEIVYTYVGTVHSGAYLPRMPKQAPAKEASEDPAFAEELFRWLEGALQRQEYEGHPFDVVPGGLGGVDEGLRRLITGKTGGRKMVYRISETDGAQFNW